MRLFYLFALLFGCCQISFAQFEERAPQYNRTLMLQQKQDRQNATTRNAACQSDMLGPVSLLAGGDTRLCVDTTCLDSPLETIQITCGATLGAASLSSSDACLDYQAPADTTGVDTVCVKICDNGGKCHTLVYSFHIRSARSLPFFDDFAYPGPYPDQNNWIDNRTFINTTLAVLPPSVGVATFDGLDAGGRPYGGGFGNADVMTSTFINLDGFAAGDDIYLNFWLQRKGLGDKPEESDVMILEFKDDQGVWQNLDTYPGFPEGTPSGVQEGFRFFSIHIDQPQYLHPSFQFRFINKNTRSGAIDLWHLDYVRLEANSSSSVHFPDIAFTNAPIAALRNYRSMPRNHFRDFEEQELADSVKVSLINHFSSAQTIDGNSAVLTELVNMISFLEFPFLTAQEESMASGDTLQKTVTNPFFTTYLVGAQNNFANEDSLILKMTYSIRESNQVPQAILNDTVNTETILTNYFAYDDGTSESNIIAQNIGTEIAVRYTANVDDTLRAIQLHFPHITQDVSSQLFNLKVYIGQLDEEAEYEAVFIKPFYTDNVFDTLQGFSTYVLFEDNSTLPKPLFVPAGDFYVSWQQVSSTEIPIGLDKNNPNGVDHAFFTTNSGASWQPFPPTFTGAIMVRPVFGKETPQDTPTPAEEVVALSEWMDIFPNPARERLYFKLKNANYADFDIELYNATGQLVLEQPLASSLSLNGLEAGLFILRVRQRQTNEMKAYKFLVVR